MKKRSVSLKNLVLVMLIVPIFFGTNAQGATIVSTSPGDEAADVPVNTVITAVFSGDMDSATITETTFFVKSGKGYGSGTVIGTVTYNEDDKTATFEPTSPLAMGITYIATIAKDVKDADGTSLGSDHTWSFTTESFISSVSPDKDETGVDVNVSVIINFSRAMDSSAINTTTFLLTTGQGYKLATVPGEVSYNEDDKRATFKPGSALDNNTAYDATLTADAKDMDGNSLQFDQTWSFTTGSGSSADTDDDGDNYTENQGDCDDTDADIHPGAEEICGDGKDQDCNGSDLSCSGEYPEVSNVITNKTDIVVSFAQAMDPLTVNEDTFIVKLEIPGTGYGIVAGKVEYEGMEAKFVPYSELIPGQKYTVTITTGAKDTDGVSLESDYVSSVTLPGPDLIKTTRDDKGIWFITGSDDASLSDVFEAMGYAVATDRLWQAETYRRTARGRLAEILGPDQLETDSFMRTIGYSDQELQESFDALDSESQSVISGYAAGFNRRIAEVRSDRSLLPFEFKAIGAALGTDFVPADWTVLDILAWEATLLRNFDPEGFQNQGQIDNASLYQKLASKFPNDFQGMFEDLRWINDPDALTYIPGNGETKKRVENRSASKKISASSLPDLSLVAENMAEIRKNVVENLKKINAYVKMGSYAWAVAGTKTASGNPIIYSGPQMGFSTPSIVVEGSVRAGSLNVSGMSVPGIPGIVIGRTPHHAWSMQVGHAHTVDYYFEDPSMVSLHRVETIRVAGQDDVQLPVYRTSHGPVVSPIPYDPETYVPDPENPIVSWKYSHWGYDLNVVRGLLALARASNMDEFGEGIEYVAVSQHFCYADRDGNIAYWMSGRDPVRPPGEYRFPQGFIPGTAPLEWDSEILITRSTDRNTSQGFYSGWNNKSSASYDSSYNNPNYSFGPFHRAHVIHEYLSTRDNLTFEELRDLALNITITDFGKELHRSGNPWEFVRDDFTTAITNAGMTDEYQAVLDLLAGWDGHFVAGGESEWALGEDLADPWVVMNEWINEVMKLTFEDELGPETYDDQRLPLIFNVLLHGLAGESSGIVNNYNWFQNLEDETAPQTAEAIIVAALDNVLADLGARPWGIGKREIITYTHDVLRQDVHTTPYAARSTYAHCVEVGPSGPVRIESMFPLGESGTILMGAEGQPVFDEHFFSMAEVYDTFAHRDFPLFD